MKIRFFDSKINTSLQLILSGILLFAFCFSACSVSSENISSASDFKSVHGKVVTQSLRRSAVFTGQEVRIENFSMCSHEVTQKEYEEFCAYNGAQPKKQFGKGEDFPVYFVSFYDALVYCNRRSIKEGLSPCYKIKNSSNPDDWGSVPKTNVDDSEWNSVECDFLLTDTAFQQKKNGNTLQEVVKNCFLKNFQEAMMFLKLHGLMKILAVLLIRQNKKIRMHLDFMI